MRLQEGSRHRVGHLFLHRLLNHLRLLVAPCSQEHLARFQNGGHTHGDGAGRNLLVVAETQRHLIAGGLPRQDDARSRCNHRTGFVRGNRSHASHAQQHDVDAPLRLDALFVVAAVLPHLLLFDAAVRCMDVLAGDVDMVEQTVLELLDAAVLRLGRQREILIGIEDHHIPKTESSFLVAVDKLAEDGSEREARSQSQNKRFPLLRFFADSLFNFIRDMSGPFLHIREDLRVDFFLSGQFASFHGISWAEELYGHFVQYDLGTQIQVHIQFGLIVTKSHSFSLQK